MSHQKIYSLKIGGQAGQGIKSAGLNFSKVATRSGFQIFNYIEYPSLIRGGHNVSQTVFSTETVSAPRQYTNLLIALDQNTVNLHQEELDTDSGIIFDPDANVTVNEDVSFKRFSVPLKKLAQESGGRDIVSNNVALGAAIALMGGNLDHLKNLISEDFSSKKEHLIQINQDAAQKGYDYANENYPNQFEKVLSNTSIENPPLVIDGAEAVAYAAIASGLQFSAIYPMSPISNILQVLATHHKDHHYILKQVEDEISAVNMTIGASYAGARSMTTTSGGGFCLMSEGFGLAGMTETPLVIVEGMRGGPATGLPTWSEQGDLRFVLHAHQGEFPRIILAAGDAKEAFYLTMEAFNLAEKYQTPVVLLIDKNICDHDQSYAELKYQDYQIDRGELLLEKRDDFMRYLNTNNGISIRTVPGIGNFFVTNSDEHDEKGFDNETVINRNTQNQKRNQKLIACSENDMPLPQVFGPEKADISLISWGSNKGSILEALKEFTNVNFMHLTWINPFPVKAVTEFLQKSKYVINIECNTTSQMAGLILEKTGINILDRFSKNDGRPIFPEEIISKINTVLNTK